MKFKKTLSVLLALAITVLAVPSSVFMFKVTASVWDGESASESYAGGSGTKDDPYLISNGEELLCFSNTVRGGTDYEGVYFALSSDIDLNWNEFPSIGVTSDFDYESASSFWGSFDGRGHSITGFYNCEQGLFGAIGGDSSNRESDMGVIKNLTVVGSVEGRGYVDNDGDGYFDNLNYDIGGIVGRAQGGNIVNCHFVGAIELYGVGFHYYGGIVGEMEQGFVESCTVDAYITVVGEHRGVGGVVGGAEYNAPIIYCCGNLGSMSVTANNPIGGIVGRGDKIINCYNIADISVPYAANEYATVTVGGIAGTGNYIYNCYNTGSITAEEPLMYAKLAGIVTRSPSEIKNCYNSGGFSFTASPDASYDGDLYSDVVIGGVCSGCLYEDAYENIYSLGSDYPVYYYEDSETYSYVSSFDGALTPEELAGEELLSTFNQWVETNEAYKINGYVGDDEKEFSFTYDPWIAGAKAPVFEGAERTATLEVFSRAWNGAQIGEVRMDGTATSFVCDDRITLEALYSEKDYSFIGWYETGDYTSVISKTKVFSFAVTEEHIREGKISLTALYVPIKQAKISIDGGSLFTVNGSEYSSIYINDHIPGALITVSVSNTEDFAYWISSNGKIVSTEPTYSFTVTSDITLSAVYNRKLENKYTVIFVSDYGQIMYRQQFTLHELESLQLPIVPVKAGFKAGAWELDREEIITAANGGADVITIRPKYPEIVDTDYVGVYGGKLEDGSAEGDFVINTPVTVIADPAEEGMKFAYWENDYGEIVSYNTVYTFILEYYIELTAVFVPDEEAVYKTGSAEITNITKQESVNGMSFSATFAVPEGCKIDFAGIVATSDSAKAEALTAENADYVRGGAQKELNGRFTWTKSNVDPNETWYARAYLVYTDAAGETHTVYSSTLSVAYNEL